MSVLLYDGNGAPLVGSEGNKFPDLPLGTYFFNAGLSREEAADASGACLRRAKVLLTKHLRELEIREPGAARRYSTDHNARNRLNQKVIAEALLEMGFSSEELRTIDQGLKMQLQSPERKPTVATVSGPDGVEEFVVERTDRKVGAEHGFVLHSQTTGIDWH